MMLVGMVAKLRNGHLLKFRLERKLNQTNAAAMCGISVSYWGDLERMNFKGVPWEYVRKIAEFLEVDVEEICPQEMKEKNYRLDGVAFKEYDKHQLASRYSECAALPSPEEEADNDLRAEAISKLLKTLTVREREIIKLRFGLEGEHVYTLSECAEIFGVTRERLRQVEARAIRKLQHPVRSRKLKGFIDFVPDESEKDTLISSFASQLEAYR